MQTLTLTRRGPGWQWAVSENGKVINSSPPRFDEPEAAANAAHEAYPEAQLLSELHRSEGQ